MYTKTSATQSYLSFLIAPLLLAAHGANALTRLQPPTAVASSSMGAPLQIRGGALSVDDEGNLYSPRQTPLSRKVETSAFANTDDDTVQKRLKRRRSPSVSPSSSRTADLASRSVLRGGTKVKNDRIGRLSVDEDGNLYSAQHLVPPPLRFRGGALSVDDEGNLYSPRTRATPTLSTTKVETTETATTFMRRTRRRTPSSSSPSSPRTADLASRTTVLGGTTTAVKNKRFGRLSVDDEGNFYTPSKSQVNAKAAALSVRGGGFSRGGPLRVPNEELREELGITFGCFLFFASLLF